MNDHTTGEGASGTKDSTIDVRRFLCTEELSEEQIQTCQFWVNANRAIRKSKQPNFRGCRIKTNEKYNYQYLEEELQEYEDKDIINFLKYGWPLNAVDTDKQTHTVPNQKNARKNVEALRKYIKSEVNRGTAIGPFHTIPFEGDCRISPLDTREKKDSTELRVILNLSSPFQRGSVNHSISKKMYLGKPMNLKYPTTDDLVDIIKNKKEEDEEVLIYKVDLSKAYRQMFMDPGDIHLLGYRIDDKFYFDITLSMGSRSAAYCCQRTTSMVTYITHRKGNREVNYLDDFGGAEVAARAMTAFNLLRQVLCCIGLDESEKKAVEPTEEASFLGIWFNTKLMTLTITAQRLNELITLLDQWEKRSQATRRDLQSLLGKLSFACNTVRAGRVFVSRLINEIKTCPDESHEISEDTKMDVRWWRRYMKQFDGITLMPSINWEAPDRVMACDACLEGGGGWCQDTCFFAAFPENLKQDSRVCINELELITIVACIKLWAARIENRNILVFCDNKTTVDVVNAGRAKNTFAQACLRELCWWLAQKNAVVKVIHKPGKLNSTADKLSRAVISKHHYTECMREIEEKNLFLTEVDSSVFSFTHDW